MTHLYTILTTRYEMPPARALAICMTLREYAY
jgi:hypothetical protein